MRLATSITFLGLASALLVGCGNSPTTMASVTSTLPNYPPDTGNVHIVGTPIIRWDKGSSRKKVGLWIYYRLDRRPGASQIAFVNGEQTVEVLNNVQPMSFAKPCYVGNMLSLRRPSRRNLSGLGARVTAASGDIEHDFADTVPARFGRPSTQVQQDRAFAASDMAAQLGCGERRR